MSNFKIVEGHYAITLSGGVYKDAALYTRKGRYFVKAGSGYISISADGSTSQSKTRLIFLSLDKGEMFKHGHGYVVEKSYSGAKPFSDSQIENLTKN